jgi:hypothetical protein
MRQVKRQLTQTGVNEDNAQRFVNAELLPFLKEFQAAYNGGVGATKSVSASETIDTEHAVFLVDATSADVTLTLPLADKWDRDLTMVKTDAAASFDCIFARAGSDTINGATSQSISTQYSVLTLTSDGVSAWYIVASS